MVDDATAAGATASETLVFQRSDGETGTAQFNGTQKAMVTRLDQASVTLAIAASVSGARYSDGTPPDTTGVTDDTP